MPVHRWIVRGRARSYKINRLQHPEPAGTSPEFKILIYFAGGFMSVRWMQNIRLPVVLQRLWRRVNPWPECASLWAVPGNVIFTSGEQ